MQLRVRLLPLMVGLTGSVWGAVPGAHVGQLPAYQSGPALQGRLSLAGTDSMAPMMRRWIDIFRACQPGVEVHFETGAPPTAAAGLAAGTADIGYTGRTLWTPEVDAIVKAQGRPPRAFRIGAGAYDDKTKTHTMAVFVHRDNPLRELSLAQVESLFADSEVLTWGKLGLGGDWAAQPVHLVTAKLGTGATNFVQEFALHGHGWSKNVNEYPTDDAAVAALAGDRFALCVAGLPYGGPTVRPLALAGGNSGRFFEPTGENVVARRYPLARLLYFHVNDSAGQPLDRPVREFLRLVLSREGQAIALEAGYLPLTPEIVQEELAKLER
ncbi:MAG: pstS [Lacunisphaera sp.]|nr:pstS [Lacunisphaera sp.]